ncbi:MAG: EAL domain-containing protein [Ruminococcus flavefaciens]|nr:EAL domain-containing protein [Ruminococcus flavefaciens]MCM1231052.1 EAL domain-containing protein [Ruminococcus flavefaciens]
MNAETEKGKKRVSSFSEKLFVPMMILSLLQIATLFGTLYISGEFRSVRQYAYDMLIEKTENRKNYIENMFLRNVPEVYQADVAINNITKQILDEQGQSVSELATDKNLNKRIISESTQHLIYLLRVSGANDAFLILDTGDLYRRDGMNNKSCVYIRDMDSSASSASRNEDLLLEAGNSDTSGEYNITLDYEWTAQINVGECGAEDNLDFYHRTIETAEANSGINVSELGYWSGFSGISPTASPSIKYTLPLIADDGTVYGVMGIGFLEKNVLKNMPSNDFFSESSCYVVGADFNGNNDYSVIVSYGSIFSRLVEDTASISMPGTDKSQIYDIGKTSDEKSIGNIQPMNLYSAESPYLNEQWALISIAEKDKVLSVYRRLIRMLVLSMVVSVVFTVIVALLIERIVTNPVKKIVRGLAEEQESNKIIRFNSSGIAEVDTLTEAIESLQINIREQASRVSKVISMVNMGIGVFMCDLDTMSVYVGESLIKLLDLKGLPIEDTNLPFENFQAYISDFDSKNRVCGSGIFSRDSEILNEEIEIRYSNEKVNLTKWYEFTMKRDGNNVLGLVQDVTSSMLEKKKIEYERDYDLTTGLLNRRAYYNKIDELFSRRDELGIAAFVMIDLDNLKYVNDTYGHDFGDDYIKTAANVFKGFRDYNGVVARMSGDEFNVFLYGYDSKDEIREVINLVRSRLLKSYCIIADGSHYKIRASAGISWYPDDSDSYEMLIKYADFTMYTVKHSTKGNIAEFDVNSYTKDSILVTGVEEMNSIIDEQRIRYAFQTIISARDGSVYGYEALMRPQSETLHSPMEFIRIAKTGAKLNDVERITWTLAFREFKKQIAQGNINPKAKIFINSLSNCTLTPEDVQLIETENADILENVVLEILEGERANPEYTRNKKNRMLHWNAMVALDDFGSGYNSEHALITLEPNLIKIDRAIINGCDSDVSRKNIILNLVRISKANNILVLAEGVETSGELRTVIECGVDLLQGYYFARPVFEPQPLPEKRREEILRFNNKI